MPPTPQKTNATNEKFTDTLSRLDDQGGAIPFGGIPTPNMKSMTANSPNRRLDHLAKIEEEMKESIKKK